MERVDTMHCAVIVETPASPRVVRSRVLVPLVLGFRMLVGGVAGVASVAGVLQAQVGGRSVGLGSVPRSLLVVFSSL